MRYTVVFADGYDDDIDSLTRDLRTDILISDEEGKLYNPFFITIERVTNEFGKNKICYLGDNLVILHSVTKDNIIKSITELYEWMFYKKWLPLSEEHLKTYFYPKENWVSFDIEI